MTTQANDLLDAALNNLNARFDAIREKGNQILGALGASSNESVSAHWTEPEEDGGYRETAEAYMVAAEAATEKAIAKIEAILGRAPATQPSEIDDWVSEIDSALVWIDSALAPYNGGDDLGLADEHPWRSGYWTAAEIFEDLRDDLSELACELADDVAKIDGRLA